MPSYLCLSVTFLDPAFHGRRDGGEPEWPPSPLRLFQALVAAAAGRWGERQRLEYAVPALKWLEQQHPPVILTPPVRTGTAYRPSVPNNAMDLVARAWSQGNLFGSGDANPATHRAMKTVRPMRMTDETRTTVHYLWELSDEDVKELEQKHKEVLFAAARSLFALGWGVDLVAGHGRLLRTEKEVADLSGERWEPSTDSDATGLRVPIIGTFDALSKRHGEFLDRLNTSEIPPLTAFAVIGYHHATKIAGREWVAFEILKPEAAGKASFDTTRRCRDVAAWVRNLTGRVCDGWRFGDTATFVHGHDPADNAKQLTGDSADDRFMYLPLPTINPKLNRVESIRRVLIAAPARFRDQVEWVRRRLPGQDLIDEERQVPVGVLNLLPKSDWVLRQYTDPAAVWSTVTPVVLPGYDDPEHFRRRLRDNRDAEVQRRLLGRLHQRVEGLIRKALCQAGFAPELAKAAELEWRRVGFRAGVDLTDRYIVPDLLGRYPRYHVRVRFPVPVRGPVAVGAGRYRGFGVFAAETRS